ncbi:phosphate acyltransferase PlsX [Neptuniibacter caesariensis]|uniref:Phosphate acyltransferase n=1 Tax=Neptuniibacter caesariensis TaxID=207954 RepID=A0A7U8C5V8_NEPCE|nr:phosphate acyltransferase PlsX [Neptuniibacter caesariensis]EAR60665.1 fatty acid/phospholipid synthesis protein PlsX [Oceanospirillum sp. MED92] [Neptuniibacter caesariensis]
MSDYYTIAVDVMGGDFGPRVTVPATLNALKRYPHLSAKLVGHQEAITPFLNKLTADIACRVEVIHAPDTIAMGAKPSQTLRNGQQSSMYKALELVSEHKAEACVSAGNTGALMVLGRYILRTLPGIDRPAIISSVPTVSGHCYMLDLGANVDCSAEHLLQFAIMGSVMTQAVDEIASPRVGLLNIGQEQVKGNEQVKLASRLIEEQGGLNYIGYIEGDDLYSGKADVVVCDGFVGNIALKSSEGLARLISKKFQSSFKKGIYRRILALLASPVLNELKKQMDPSRRNGASLLGLQGIVIKSHGSANKKCFGFALEQAVAEIEQNVPRQICREIEDKLA